MTKTRSSVHGQILIPGLCVIFVLLLLFLDFMHWGSNRLWQMRMDTAADAAALSASRAQADQLNTISTLNMGVNLYIKKTKIPFRHREIGVLAAEDIPAYIGWNQLLKKAAWGFKTFPAGVGEEVARLNGAEGYSPYFPFPMSHELIAVSMPVFLYSKSPPALTERQYEGVYFARGWRPGITRAQPTHKTTWLVSRKNIRSIASARLWLDVSSDSLLHNGGFPRMDETWLRDVFIQDFYPQFNARLLASPVIGMEKLLARGRP